MGGSCLVVGLHQGGSATIETQLVIAILILITLLTLVVLSVIQAVSWCPQHTGAERAATSQLERRQTAGIALKVQILLHTQ